MYLEECDPICYNCIGDLSTCIACKPSNSNLPDCACSNGYYIDSINEC
jgi:hypothetical protein